MTFMYRKRVSKVCKRWFERGNVNITKRINDVWQTIKEATSLLSFMWVVSLCRYWATEIISCRRYCYSLPLVAVGYIIYGGRTPLQIVGNGDYLLRWINGQTRLSCMGLYLFADIGQRRLFIARYIAILSPSPLWDLSYMEVVPLCR